MVRYPVVAGQFYPASSIQLRSMIKGMVDEKFHFLTIQQLQEEANGGDNLVLVDLRQVMEVGDAGNVTTPSPDKKSPDNLTDLAAKFPGLKIVVVKGAASQDSKTLLSAVLEKIAGQTENLLVLVDNGNGVAESVALRLMAAGFKRLAIAMGGERAISRDGKPSLKTVTGGN